MPVSGSVLAAYADQATDYERRTALYQEWRELFVDQLPLRRGDVVLDEAPAMPAPADRHVTEHGWRNVELLATSVQDAIITEPADAALFSAVHDVLQSPAALHTVLTALRPGAWVGAAGGKWPDPWLGRPLHRGRRGARPVRPGLHRFRLPLAVPRRAGRPRSPSAPAT